MPVVQRTVLPPAKKVLPKTAPAKFVKAPKPEDAMELPTERKEVEMDISRYMFLIYGREKIGKTTAFSSWPDVIFLNTELGAKGLKIFEFNSENGGVTSWPIFLKAVDLLCKSDRFKSVVIDTADRLYELCMDYVCHQLGIKYPGVDSSGEQDFGKSWRAVKAEFIAPLIRLQQSKRGVCLTSHCKTEEVKTKSGDKYDCVRPSMSKQARETIEATVDYFFYAEYMRAADGSTKRVLICEGDETIWAGHRAVDGLPDFPRFLPLEKNAFEVIHNAFLGEDVGLDPRTFMPARTTTKAGQKFMVNAKVKANSPK